MSAYRLIDAQFPGHCAECHGVIDVGDDIWWAPGEPTTCIYCPPDDDLAPPPAGGTTSATAAERETGEERTRRVVAEKAEAELTALRMRVVEVEACTRNLAALVAHLYAQLGEPVPQVRP